MPSSVSPDHIRELDWKTLGRREIEIEKHANSEVSLFPDFSKYITPEEEALMEQIIDLRRDPQ